jgi:hypothetical protein
MAALARNNADSGSAVGYGYEFAQPPSAVPPAAAGSAHGATARAGGYRDPAQQPRYVMCCTGGVRRGVVLLHCRASGGVAA